VEELSAAACVKVMKGLPFFYAFIAERESKYKNRKKILLLVYVSSRRDFLPLLAHLYTHISQPLHIIA
jgi:hypothetical protein